MYLFSGSKIPGSKISETNPGSIPAFETQWNPEFETHNKVIMAEWLRLPQTLLKMQTIPSSKLSRNLLFCTCITLTHVSFLCMYLFQGSKIPGSKISGTNPGLSRVRNLVEPTLLIILTLGFKNQWNQPEFYLRFET